MIKRFTIIGNKKTINKRQINDDILNKLEFYIKFKFYDNIETIISEKQININQHFLNGATPLQFAVESEDMKLIKYLIENDANVNLRNSNGSTPFTYILKYYCDKIDFHRQIFRLFLQNGANINGLIPFNWPPLVDAIDYNKLEFLKLLLESNCNCLNIISHRDETIYELAMAKDNNSALIVLLNNYVDPEILNYYAETPLEQCCALHKLEKVCVLLNYNAKFKYWNACVRSFFMYLLIVGTEDNMIIFCLYHLIKRYPNDILTMLTFYEYQEFMCYFDELLKMQRTNIIGFQTLTFYQLLICDIKVIAFLIINTTISVNFTNINYEELTMLRFPLFSKFLLFKFNEARNISRLLKLVVDKLLKKCPIIRDLFHRSIIERIIRLLNFNEINRFMKEN